MADFPTTLDFAGRRVLVTGGARGIGKGAVKAFVELNATVFVLDKDEETIAELKLEYPSVTVVKVDLRDWDGTREAVKPLLPIHHLVNNAGVAIPGSVLEIDEKHVDMYLEINFKQVLNVSQVVANGMIEHNVKGGTIVNLSSIADTMATLPSGNFFIPMYSCTKASVTMLTKVLALELAPHGIRTNAIRPGAVDTQMIGALDKLVEKSLKNVFDRMVLTRGFLSTTDLAKGIVYLSSGLSSGITGTAMSIDAGYSMF